MDIDLVAMAVIKGETFGSAVGLVDVADIKIVGQGELFIVMSDGKSKIAAEADRGADFVVVKLSEFDGVDAVGISQFLLGNAVGDIDLERAGLCQRRKVVTNLTAGGYETSAVGECKRADEVLVIAAISDRVPVDYDVLVQKADGLLVTDKSRPLPVDGNGLIGLVEYAKFDLAAVAGDIIDEPQGIVLEDELVIVVAGQLGGVDGHVLPGVAGGHGEKGNGS